MRRTFSRRAFLRTSLAAVNMPFMSAGEDKGSDMIRPNIVWLTCEDMGPNLGCYGDTFARTPNIDAFAQKSLRYDFVWSNAPVCAPARTAIITGMYPTSLGAEHMRSYVDVPKTVRLYPQILREYGYYCTNNSKEDYNVRPNGEVWDESSPQAHWKNRTEGQPFFAVFNFTTTHESQIRVRPHALRSDPTQVSVPPYHPDTPEVRHDWAQYYDKIEEMDTEFGARLGELEQAGLLENTIVFFYSDHGCGMPRHKRWLYDSGLHVPLLVYIPERYHYLAPPEYRPGGSTRRLVSFVDLAPTVLSLAGIQPPDIMQGRAFMGKYQQEPAKYLFGFRGRMDERIDMLRSVTDGRYVYIRNYMPHLIYGQYLAYMWQTPTTRVWESLYKEGKLTPPRTYFWEPKPPEELYDLQTDPHEVRNLATSPEFREKRDELKSALREHAFSTRDTGYLPEPEAHRRAGNTPIFEMAADSTHYPLERIYDTAELAADRDPSALPQLVEACHDDDPAVRYWAMLGILIRGKNAFHSAIDVVRQGISDENPCVRMAAAEILGTLGEQADVEQALDTLGELAAPDKNGAYAAIAAINTIERLGDKAARLKPLLNSIPLIDPNAPPRMNEYVKRLVPSRDTAPQ